MATVIRAIGANFTNENIIGNERLNYDGLKFAIRPSTDNELKDLSGNGLIPAVRGVLEYNEQSVICKAGRNGFRVDVSETPSFTWFNTFKNEQNTNGKNAVICMNTWAKTSSGSSIHVGGGLERVSPQWFDADGSSTFYHAENTFNAAGWRSVAYVMDASQQKVTLYYIKNGVVSSETWTKKKSAPTVDIDVRNRPIVASDKLSFGIISKESVLVSDTLFMGDYYCAEALAYDRALGESEVVAQLMRTKTAMAAKGIIL